MSITNYGVTPRADTPQKESAGGCDTTTAETNNATETIALNADSKGFFSRVGFQAASLPAAWFGRAS
jgi:hypothetical protein